MFSPANKMLEIAGSKGALKAALTWPIFSLASFKIVTRAKRAGVSPRTVIDVGANKGQFSVACLELFDGAAVFSIEPDQAVAGVLRSNLKKKHDRRVTVDVCAISSEVGQVTFHVNSDSQVSSLLPLGQDRKTYFPRSMVEREVVVPANTVDSLFNERSMQEPILLKIDAQGAEDLVLEGAVETLRRVRWIIIEVSFKKLYEGEKSFMQITEKLASHGFHFVRPLNVHLSPQTHEIMEMDALFETVGTRQESERGVPNAE